MKKAFSLIELLISLIVISIITTALAPVITKKLKYKNITMASKQMKIDCAAFDSKDGSCLMCDEKQCSLCTSSISVPTGYYVNPNLSCDYKPCSGFDAQCKSCTKEGCEECNAWYELTAEKKCKKITTCNKGYYVQGSECKQCPENYIQPNDTSIATSCTPCPSGQISNDQRSACVSIFDTKTFYYTGGVQTWTVPFNGTFKFEVYGAQGGAAKGPGGYGGYAQGRKTLSAGQTVYIYVGGMGSRPQGGFNGGGTGGSNEGGGGGGATDIRIGGTDWANRIIVAGGGGGGGTTHLSGAPAGGAGGGTNGGSGTNYNGSAGGCGAGGTQSSGASIGYGGSTSVSYEGGGGGGGYFGGRVGTNYNGGAGGGGGSGFIGGVTQGSMSNGTRSGNGVAIISKV